MADVAHEGKFIWGTDYLPPEYTNWAIGQPDNWGDGHSEDCVFVNGHKKYEWDDDPCGTMNVAHALCQKQA